MDKNKPLRFMGTKDLFVTTLVEIIIASAAIGLTVTLHQYRPQPILNLVVAFILFQLMAAFLVLSLLKNIFPVKEGFYSASRNPWRYYNYRLQSFILIMNLSLLYFPHWCPVPLRKTLFQILGAKLGKGIMIIAGQLGDPLEQVTIEPTAVVGYNAFICPHFQTIVDGEDVLVVSPILIKRGAIIGAHAVISPGVTVGENAVVNAMSFVPTNIKIGPGEIWGGNPAKKVGEAGGN